MSNKTRLNIVSMLVDDRRLMLFTETGDIVEIVYEDDTYNIFSIIEYLTTKLTGVNIVEMDLAEFAVSCLTKSALVDDGEYLTEGKIITSIVNGEEIEGIFFAKKTQIAVVVNGEKVAIPDINRLDKQIQRSVDENSPGAKNFVRRLATVIDKRKHSGDDLLKFIEKSELPLTDSGMIIAYKRVRKSTKQGYFVDCHTGSVQQRIGSLVTMDVDLIDSSQHTLCSSGLHVANLGYMAGYTGDTIMIVLVKPEDFIAVPHNQATKARVCAYHIIGLVTGKDFTAVVSSNAISDTGPTSILISKAIAGEVAAPIEEVKVGVYGAFKAMKLSKSSKRKVTASKPKPKAGKKPSGAPLKASKPIVKGVKSDAVELSRKLKHKVSGKTKAGNLSVPKQAEILFAAWDAKPSGLNLTKLVNFKKTKKKSWVALGLNKSKISRIEKELKK